MKQHKQSAVILALVVMTACAGRGNIDTTVTYVAGYGEQVSAILSEGQDLVIKGTPKPIPEDMAAKAMVQLRNAGEATVRLANALAAYDALTADDTAGRAAKVQEIRGILDELRRYTRVVLVFVGDNPIGTQLLTLYDNLDKVFTEIQAGFDAATP